MSFSQQAAKEFFAPLKGKAATFIHEDRSANVRFSRSLMSLIAATGASCGILDIDAFYSSNSDRVFDGVGEAAARRIQIVVPAPDSEIEEEFSRFIGGEYQVVIIDSLNSLYHLLSVDDSTSRGRKMSFAVEALSYAARSNAKTVILSMYRREGSAQPNSARSISGFSDAALSVKATEGGIELRSERGSVWPGGRFSIRNPSGWRG